MTFIYAIQHNFTKKMYIGKSKNVYKRYMSHIYQLRANSHSSKEMQNDFNKYGEDYSVYILEEVENGKEHINVGPIYRTKERQIELDWMIKYDTINSGYNLQDYVAHKMADMDPHDIFPIKDGLPK